MKIEINLSALAMPTDGDEMTMPEAGDAVQAVVEGTLSEVRGQTAVIAVTTVNGEPVGDEEAMPEMTPEEAMAAEGASLEAMMEEDY